MPKKQVSDLDQDLVTYAVHDTMGVIADLAEKYADHFEDCQLALQHMQTAWRVLSEDVFGEE